MLSPISYFKHPRLIGLSFLGHFGWILSDKQYLKCRFRLEMGKKLNLKNPQTFQEKIQWLKLYDRKPEYTTMVDKAAVKQYVADIIGEDYVIPTLGVWETPDQIDFDSLPDQFVLKTTHGGGGGGVIICRDKSKLDIEAAKAKLKNSLSSDIYRNLREWPYKNVPRRIIADKFINLEGTQDLTDYKIYCFNGEPRYIQVIQDRHVKETIDFFDMDWNRQEFFGLNPVCRPSELPIGRPSGLQKMQEIAKTLSQDTKFLRVDLYNLNGKIYFGEITFYPASGMGIFTPEEYDLKLGKLISLPK